MAERSKPLLTSSGFYRPSRVYMVMSGAPRRNDSRLRSPWLKLRASSAALGFQDQGTADRPWRHGVRRLAGRLRQTRRRGEREMGEGGQVRRHQAGVTE